METWISVGSLAVGCFCLLLWRRERRKRFYESKQAKAEDLRWRTYSDQLTRERDQARLRLSAIRKQCSES